MHHARFRMLTISGIILAAGVAFYTATEIYRDLDYLDYFRNRKGQLAGVGVTVLHEGSNSTLYEVRLRNNGKLVVTAYLRVPSVADGPLPAIIALGGVRTGKKILDHIGSTPGVIVLALDYPYDGKRTRLGVWEFVWKLPAIRRALLDTVPASLLAVDYLLARDDVDAGRIIFTGGSVGAVFGPVVGAADSRIAAVALLLGAGDLRSVFRANIDAPAPVAAAGAWLASLIVSPLEPLKYVGRISPRPLFMMNAKGDSRMPVDAAKRLHAAARVPKTIRWIDAGHVDIRSGEFHGMVRRELAAWLSANGFVDAADLPVVEPGGADD